MIKRELKDQIENGLKRQAVVAILGPRQVGKTTLAIECSRDRDAIYIDLEDADQRAKLDDPSLFFEHTKQSLVILDEIHRMPELFQTLRGVVDRGRREGVGLGRFLVLGSASIDLLRQSGESLAGRISYFELTPLQLREVAIAGHSKEQLWLRGGFPGSLLATSDLDSNGWRRDFIRTYLEREIAIFGGRLPAETLGRLWTMMAHRQGGLLNISELSRSLGVSSQSVGRYTDLLVDLLLVRRLQPFHANVGKRLIKSPKYYIRDSGILHCLLGIESFGSLTNHPVIGMSWEGFVIEQIIAALPDSARSYFYRTAVGAEIDLLIEFANGQIWAVEIKRRSTKTERGFFIACNDINANRRMVIHGGDSSFPMREQVEAFSVEEAVNVVRHGN